MPVGPNGEKRPAGVIANAVHMARIATGEIEETVPKGKRVSVTLKTEKKRPAGGRVADAAPVAASGQG